MPLTLELEQLYMPVKPELDAVRMEVDGLWRTMLQFVNGPDSVCPKSGGKLLRPALCLLSAGAAGSADVPFFVPMAASMELFHLAALAHDDVLDGAHIRRGVTSLNAMWNDHAAILGGDYLVARGISALASYGECGAVANAVDCIRLMAEGELKDFGAGSAFYSEEGCIELACAKTASLFSVACSTPSFFRGADHREALHQYGLHIGSAFQLIDDILDLTQDEETLGKPVCGDVVEGKKTLPILFLRRSLAPDELARLDGMRGAPLSPQDKEWVAAKLEASGAVPRTEAMARDYVQEARKTLLEFPPSSYRDSMAGLAEFVLMRGF